VPNMGASGECFRDDQAPYIHRLGGAWCGCGDPDVVISDAADLVEAHTLRVVKPSDSHSRTACSLVSTTALNCIAGGDDRLRIRSANADRIRSGI